jgi:AraC family transcriptional regulator
MDSKQHLSAVVLDSLDAAGDTNALARQAYTSRSSFFRLFQALIEESPGAMRRRVLLERAAWYLASTQHSVTQIALEAGYGSLEAFTRAFRRAFKLSPSLYRRTGCSRIHLPAPNVFHFLPPNSQSKGARTNMDLFDIFAGTDSWYTRRLLQQAATLSDEQLDRPVHNTARMFGWDNPDSSLREILERIVLTKAVWTAALTNSDVPPIHSMPPEDRTPAALLDRFERSDAQFHAIMRDVRDRGAWDDTFVDALCEPPETFTFGGTFAHVITFNTGRRLAALDAFHSLGINIQGTGCPMEYQASTGE